MGDIFELYGHFNLYTELSRSEIKNLFIRFAAARGFNVPLACLSDRYEYVAFQYLSNLEPVVQGHPDPDYNELY